MSVTGRLENWYYDQFFHVVWGEINGDTKNRFANGMQVHTSHIVSHSRNNAHMLKEGDVILTLNSTYKLGKPFVRPSE